MDTRVSELDCMAFFSVTGFSCIMRTSLSPCCNDEGLKCYEENEHLIQHQQGAESLNQLMISCKS
jgi:hypothetical protein